jgi:hypothetical protein
MPWIKTTTITGGAILNAGEVNVTPDTAAICERLDTFIAQQAEMIALLRALQAAQELQLEPKGRGPYLEGNGE